MSENGSASKRPQPPQPTTTGLPAKKTRRSPEVLPAEFWDRLSTIRLTRSALQELGQRISKSRSKRRFPGTSQLIPAKDYLTNASKEELVKIKNFVRRDRPDLSDLRGYRNPTMRAATQAQVPIAGGPQGESESTITRSSPYHGNFEQHLLDHDIFNYNHDYGDDQNPPEPVNFGEIQERLRARRKSLSLSEFSLADFRKFKRAAEQNVGETKILTSILPAIRGTTVIPSEEDVIFNNLVTLTDDTIVKARPDCYDGASKVSLCSKAQKELDHLIIPSTNSRALILPNFFTEVKTFKGSVEVAGRQACYDGALGARAMQSIQSYGTDPVYDEKAYTITTTYCGDTLRIYATHQIMKAGATRPTYHMTALRAFLMTDTIDTFREGATAYRNARDFAKEQRDHFISQANAMLPESGKANDAVVEHIASEAVREKQQSLPATQPAPETESADRLTEPQSQRMSKRKRRASA